MNMMMSKSEALSSSFRDPSGFLFSRDGELYRQVNQHYQKDYDLLMESGLYEDLVKRNLLVPHIEVEIEPPNPNIAYKVIAPEKLSFISYPYEWCFSQLKQAALTTLRIQKRALKFGLSLKDSSSYNIQFQNGKPIFIDTLSFEKYRKGYPWDAYRQFCQHFLAPLALIAHTDVRLSQLLRVYIDGVPLDLTSKLLPFRTKLNFAYLTHIHFHARAQKRYADEEVQREQTVQNRQISKTAFLGLIDSLERAIQRMSWLPVGTDWGAYDTFHNYTDSAKNEKHSLVKKFLEATETKTVWDLGANTGEFSRIASEQGIFTVSFDIDPAAVERNYLQIRNSKEQNLLPLVLDLTNPSPNIGWENNERDSFSKRGPVDMIFALALIHHLAISNNIPLRRVSHYFASLTHWLIIEFVPKEDSQVKKLLATRQDIFQDYTLEGFEDAFSSSFHILKKERIDNSMRTLFLMERLN